MDENISLSLKMNYQTTKHSTFAAKKICTSLL